ncbi:MAG TPA: hypothetical protein VFF52_26025 [Isosphaeraceae bacterium]|nr:hypothetical protein [Isosphaeraceae bacterium]
MAPVRFPINHRAFMGYTTLTPEEQAAVQGAIEPLIDRPEQEWPAHGAIRLEYPEPVYFLKVDPSLRAYVQPTPDGRPELLDLIRRELLEFLSKRWDGDGMPSNKVPSVP